MYWEGLVDACHGIHAQLVDLGVEEVCPLLLAACLVTVEGKLAVAPHSHLLGTVLAHTICDVLALQQGQTSASE